MPASGHRLRWWLARKADRLSEWLWKPSHPVRGDDLTLAAAMLDRCGGEATFTSYEMVACQKAEVRRWDDPMDDSVHYQLRRWR